MALDLKKIEIEGGQLTITVRKTSDGNLQLDFSQVMDDTAKAELLCMLSMAAVQTLDAAAITIVLHKNGQAQILNAENLPLDMMANALQQVVDELKRRAKEIRRGG